jgi:hypothetical protein
VDPDQGEPHSGPSALQRVIVMIVTIVGRLKHCDVAVASRSRIAQEVFQQTPAGLRAVVRRGRG